LEYCELGRAGECANLLREKIDTRAEARLFARVKEELVSVTGTVVHRYKNRFVVALEGGATDSPR
jgi:hypothetical protein